MIIFELFILQYNVSNLSWKDRKITLSNNQINIVPLTILHIPRDNSVAKYDDINSLSNSLVDLNIDPINKTYTYTDDELIKYWINNISQYSQYFNIDFAKLKIRYDYVLAPIYINSNNIFIGIIILDVAILYKMSKMSNMSNIGSLSSNMYSNMYSYNNLEKISVKYNFLSYIKPLRTVRKCDVNKWSILNGIFNHIKSINSKSFNNKYIRIGELHIPLKHILANARNYLPKLDIVIKEPVKHLQSGFKLS